MISVDLVFLFLAGVSFLGFILNALFDKLRIVHLMPLMIIGVLIGPIFNFVSTGPGSVIASLTPFITAITVAFILFDVGLNINLNKLGDVISRATMFTLSLCIVTALVSAMLAALVFSWPITYALIFGFAICGTSMIAMPTITRLIKIPERLKIALVYESVTSDAYQLVVPTLILTVLVSGDITAVAITQLVVVQIFGAIVFGGLSAVFWMWLMRRFSEYSKEYGWMLTVTMIIATYGLADSLGFSGLFTVFAFALIFSAIGAHKADKSAPVGSITALVDAVIDRYLFIGPQIDYIKSYQKEIAFFTSTFFFVYIGLLFQASSASMIVTALGAVLISMVILLIRPIFIPMLRDFMSSEKVSAKKERLLASINIGRGLSPAVVATLPLSYGIVIPNFLDAVFILILLTNIIATIGIFILEKPQDNGDHESQKPNAAARAQQAAAGHA
jgi:NhaP-type Na+/H+ or K+/H+ antiporter